MEIWLPILIACACYLTPSFLLFKKQTPDKKLTNFNALLIGIGLLAHFTILKASISFNPINLGFSNALIATSFFSILIFWWPHKPKSQKSSRKHQHFTRQEFHNCLNKKCSW
jgi:hypothetical protein